MAVTCTYLPPIWLITLAYWFSAPTATIVLLESAALVDPGLAEHAAASAATAMQAAATAAGLGKGMLKMITVMDFVCNAVWAKMGTWPID
jgi:hypothetical protein